MTAGGAEESLTPPLSPEYRGEGASAAALSTEYGGERDQGAESVTAERDDYFGSREYRDEGLEAGTWLSPIELRGDGKAGPASGSSAEEPAFSARPPRSRRASDKGFLPLSLSDYLRLLDWTGRQARDGKRGAIPGELAPILERLQIAADRWLDMVLNFRRWFRRAAGRADSLAAEAARRGRQWLHGVVRSRAAFA